MQIINWFIKSSANPANISLTLKGLVSFLVIIGLDATLLDGLTSNFVDLIVLLGQIITTLMALWGFARKIVNSFE